MAVQPSGAAAECFGSVGTRAASSARASISKQRLESLAMTSMLAAGEYVRPVRYKRAPRARAPGAPRGAQLFDLAEADDGDVGVLDDPDVFVLYGAADAALDADFAAERDGADARNAAQLAAALGAKRARAEAEADAEAPAQDVAQHSTAASSSSSSSSSSSCSSSSSSCSHVQHGASAAGGGDGMACDGDGGGADDVGGAWA